MIRPLAGLALTLFALGLASAAWADDEAAPVATADAGPGGFTLDDQIAAWRAAGEPSATADLSAQVQPTERDRRPHGVVSVGIGTGGYRSVYGQTDLPVGRTGTLSLAIGDERGRIFGRDVHARSLAIGLSFDGAAAPACPPALAPKDAPWRRYDAFELQRLQAACDAAQP